MHIRKFVVFAVLIAACSKDSTTGPSNGETGTGSVRVINANPNSVDVLVDGVVTQSAVPTGATIMLSPVDGQHNVGIRVSGSSTAANIAIKTSESVPRTIAALRAMDGSLAARVLDDTASIVPAGATKVRVLHLALKTGTLQVYRTAPDFATPSPWQFPFNYQTEVTGPGAPFYQSTPGTWEIHIWQTPASSFGWDSAPIKLAIPLGSGERRTVVITDKPGGGIQAQVIN